MPLYLLTTAIMLFTQYDLHSALGKCYCAHQLTSCHAIVHQDSGSEAAILWYLEMSDTPGLTWQMLRNNKALEEDVLLRDVAKLVQTERTESDKTCPPRLGMLYISYPSLRVIIPRKASRFGSLLPDPVKRKHLHNDNETSGSRRLIAS